MEFKVQTVAYAKTTAFCSMTSCSFVDRYGRFGRTLLLQVIQLEAEGSFETLVPINQATRRHIPEDGNLNIYCWTYMWY
jgi:hypothetical protein